MIPMLNFGDVRFDAACFLLVLSSNLELGHSGRFKVYLARAQCYHLKRYSCPSCILVKSALSDSR